MEEYQMVVYLEPPIYIKSYRNAFGILSNQFRIFMKPIGLVTEKVESIALHNALSVKVGSGNNYNPPRSLDTENPDTHITEPGEWREDCSTVLTPLCK